MARHRRRKRLRRLLPAAVLIALAAGAAAWYFANRGPSTTRTGKDGAPAVLIPAGSFTFGDDEVSPLRNLSVDAFYMDRYEITTARYRKFLESTGSQNTPDHWDAIKGDRSDEMPVVGVSWSEANAYCRWAGRRLPTEAEWEKAARGADARIYPWGDQPPSPDRANYGNGAEGPYDGALSPVGTHPAGRSPYGVDDLEGNVSEWVADWFGESFASDDTFNPRGPAEGEKRVIRGAGRYDPPERLIAAARWHASPDTRSDDMGFRCASDP
jgi:formylglycine-generating enzyme required for sulfatase activity